MTLGLWNVHFLTHLPSFLPSFLPSSASLQLSATLQLCNSATLFFFLLTSLSLCFLITTQWILFRLKTTLPVTVSSGLILAFCYLLITPSLLLLLLLSFFLSLSLDITTASDYLKQRVNGVVPHILIICGSGLGGIADFVNNPTIVDFKDIPHFVAPTGNEGALLFWLSPFILLFLSFFLFFFFVFSSSSSSSSSFLLSSLSSFFQTNKRFSDRFLLLLSFFLLSMFS